MKLPFEWTTRNKRRVVIAIVLIIYVMFLFNILYFRDILVKSILVMIVAISGGILWLLKKL